MCTALVYIARLLNHLKSNERITDLLVLVFFLHMLRNTYPAHDLLLAKIFAEESNPVMAIAKYAPNSLFFKLSSSFAAL